MAEKVTLPFHVPVFASTQGTAAPAIPMEDHPSAYNQMLNQCVTLFCTRKFLHGYTTPQVCVYHVDVNSFSCLERYHLSMKFIYRHYKDVIKEMLKAGYYIYYTGIDDFYLKGKSWYQARHLEHDGILCGYDDEKKTFSVAAYDTSWVFNLIEIPQKCFDKAIKHSAASGSFGTVTAYKVKDEKVELNKKQIATLIRKYLDTTSDKYRLDLEGDVMGTAVHDFIAMYMDKLKDGSVPADKMDWRIMRPIWEHKRCMYDRILAIENSEGWDHAFSQEYAELVEEANRARVMYAIYHRRKKPALLDETKKSLLSIKEKEMDILDRFVSKLEDSL